MHHAEHIGGAAVIVDSGAMDNLIDRLQNGDPTLGWEGDPNLCVAFDKLTQRWEIHRLEHDGQYRLVMRSRPGMPFPHNVIEWLVQHDTKRGYDFAAAVAKEMEQQEKARHAAFLEKIAPGHEKALWAARKGALD